MQRLYYAVHPQYAIEPAPGNVNNANELWVYDGVNHPQCIYFFPTGLDPNISELYHWDERITHIYYESSINKLLIFTYDEDRYYRSSIGHTPYDNLCCAIYSLVPGETTLTLEHIYNHAEDEPLVNWDWVWATQSVKDNLGNLHTWHQGYYTPYSTIFNPSNISGTFRIGFDFFDVRPELASAYCDSHGGLVRLGNNFIATDGNSLYKSPTGEAGTWTLVLDWKNASDYSVSSGLKYTYWQGMVADPVSNRVYWMGYNDSGWPPPTRFLDPASVGDYRDIWCCDADGNIINSYPNWTGYGPIFMEQMIAWHVAGQCKILYDSSNNQLGVYGFSWGDGSTLTAEPIYIYKLNASWANIGSVPQPPGSLNGQYLRNNEGIVGWNSKFYALIELMNFPFTRMRLVSWNPSTNEWITIREHLNYTVSRPSWSGTNVIALAGSAITPSFNPILCFI
jgi:hypothetical protein